MPSTRRYLCEDEKADVKECMFAEKRVSRINIRIIKEVYMTFYYFIIDSSSSIYVSTSVNINLLFLFNVIK
jgi:hypothetical protein